MIKLKLEERSLQKALKNVANYSARKQVAIQKQIAASTLTIETTAKQNAPVGTPESTGIKGYHGGRLRASIASNITANKGEVGTNVEYAPFVELGTYKMSARPFLFTAWNLERPKFINSLKMILKK